MTSLTYRQKIPCRSFVITVNHHVTKLLHYVIISWQVLRPPGCRRSPGFPRWPHVGRQGTTGANGSLRTALFSISKQIRPQTQVSNQRRFLQNIIFFHTSFNSSRPLPGMPFLFYVTLCAIVDLQLIISLLCGFMCYIWLTKFNCSLFQKITQHTSVIFVTATISQHYNTRSSFGGFCGIKFPCMF